jgi:hypothetical protein
VAELTAKYPLASFNYQLMKLAFDAVNGAQSAAAPGALDADLVCVLGEFIDAAVVRSKAYRDEVLVACLVGSWQARH